jgi:CHASE2 domain-containing sensor protein
MSRLQAQAVARWHALGPRTRHWLINIWIGIAIVTLLNWAGHGLRLPIVVNAQNSAFDRMIRASAVAALDGHEGLPAPPRLVLIDIDDQTWRDARWGGGEPARAPRELLASLIEGAFQRGASQVVLDIAVEGSTGREHDLLENRLFAARLDAMLAAPWFGADRQLVLVRTLRQPLAAQGRLLVQAANETVPFDEGFFDELRESPGIDAVVARSQGRIVLAAPFFSISPDRVLRDWQLLQAVCARSGAPGEGVVRVVPSVQVAVAARHFGLPAGAEPWQGAAPAARCAPFPLDAGMLGAVPHDPKLPIALLAQADAAVATSWHATQQAFAKLGVRMSAQMPRVDDLGNRVVFRWASAPSVVPAIAMIFGQVRHDLKGRVVLIGETFPETVDHHFTPLGDMPGAVVLLNAIDSMTRHRIVGTPSAWITVPLALTMIIVVGYAFARWSSVLGTIVATCAILAVLPWISFSLFKQGVWLDFALPLLGIQLHKLITSLEESLARRQKAATAARRHEAPLIEGLAGAQRSETMVPKERGLP